MPGGTTRNTFRTGPGHVTIEVHGLLPRQSASTVDLHGPRGLHYRSKALRLLHGRELRHFSLLQTLVQVVSHLTLVCLAESIGNCRRSYGSYAQLYFICNTMYLQ